MLLGNTTIASCQSKASERTFVDTVSSRKIKLKCMEDDNKSIGIYNEMLATIDTPHSHITGPPSIIKFDTDGTAYTIIQNCAPYVIWIERNDPLGFVEHHTEHKSKKWIKSLCPVWYNKFPSVARNNINPRGGHLMLKENTYEYMPTWMYQHRIEHSMKTSS